ncbi:anti-sigma factor [Cohnella fermenti]|uniref:Anti-sigma K factor RskA C-terminal domain-containing protein n=1 Tax=Cohnella fermenti TaxID=2565925 RepID=A0A4S4BPB7_9BACL|nr:anti-sigma factor [Cohnella fermenti]THF75854.1 hypothetical protein E6C55_20330 [Cohnella fermenti]
MDKRSCFVPETAWIDYHLGKLPPSEEAALRRHRGSCADCLSASREWEALLGAAASPTIVTDPAPADAAVPARAPAGLRARVVLHGAARRAGRALAALCRRRALAAVSIAAVAIALAAFAFQGLGGSKPSVDPQDYAERHEPNAALVLSRPDTVVYRLGSSTVLPAGAVAPLTRETVWINRRTHELFVLMEGMIPSGDLDVQLWAYADGNASNLGLLQFNDNLAHLYSSNVRPDEWESLALTLEPKGGSLAPTSPETASVKLDEAE